jgi:hypothetical protein
MKKSINDLERDKELGKLKEAGYKLGEESYKFTVNEKLGNLSAVIGQRITSLEELLQYFEVDATKWKVKKWECSTYESHVKLKEGGKEAPYSHRVIPLYRVWAQFEENTPIIDVQDFKAEAIREIKQHKPKYRKPAYKKDTEPYLYEINPCDVHFGKHAWGKETGEDWDIDIASKALNKSVDEHINISMGYNIDRYLFVVGNDFFNVDG